MTFIKRNVKDNAEGQLQVSITSTALTVQLKTGDGAKLPPAPCILTINEKIDGIITKYELVYVEDKTGDTLTVQRGFGDTLPQSFDADDYISCFVVADVVKDMQDAITDETADRISEDAKKLNNSVVDIRTTNYTFLGSELNNKSYLTTTTSGNITYTLDPTLFDLSDGCFEFTFMKISSDANTVIIDAGSGKTIDGSQTYTLSSQWETVTIRILSGTSCKVIATSNKLITIDLPYITKIFTAGEDMTPGKHFRFGVNITIAYSGVGNTSSNTTTSTGTPKYQTISWASSKFNVSSIMHRMSSNSGTHTVSCEIRDATGVTVIATAVATVTVNVTEADYTFTFSSPPTLLPGVTYRIYWIGGNANLNHRAGTNVYADGQSDIGSSNDYYFSMSGNRIIDEDVTKMYIANSSVGGLYTKTKVVGVVKTSVLANNTFTAILSGECDFYSGLTRGEIYKLQDDGSLNTTDGSTVIKSGRAISTTAINFVPPL